MFDPILLETLQGFAYGIAQNCIVSAVVEAKNHKDFVNEAKAKAILDQHEQTKTLQDKIGQKVYEAFCRLSLKKVDCDFLLTLANNPVLAQQLAQQILSDSYSSASVATIISDSIDPNSPLDLNIPEIASLLISSIQNAIADDSHLHRLKTLQFQANISQDVAEIKANTETTQHSLSHSTQVMVSAVNQLQEFLAKQSILSDGTGEIKIQEKIYNARIDQARKLMEAGKLRTARDILMELRNEVKSIDASKSLLFRIATNVGSCSLQLDDQETAIKELELAYQLDGENPKAITNYAVISLLRGQPEQAFELASKARFLSPNDSIPTANYIQTLFALKRNDELPQLLASEPWIEKDANCCFAISTLFFDQRHYQEAEKFARLGLIVAPTEPRLLMMLAHVLLRPLQEEMIGRPVLDWKLNASKNPNLQEAENLLSKAIGELKNSEDLKAYGFAHTLRADIRRMFGDEDGAISDCEIALHTSPSDGTALTIKALAEMHAKHLEEAIKCFEAVLDEETRSHNLIPLSICYNATKLHDKAVAMLMPSWEKVVGRLEEIQIADQLLWAFAEMGDVSQAETVIKKIQSVWLNSPEALASIGRYRAHQGDEDKAIGLFTEALAYSSSPTKDFITLELADLLYRRNDFAKAAELYGDVADLSNDNETSRKYLVCLYNARLHKEALRLAKAIRGQGDPSQIVGQIEANLLAEIGDLAAAQSIMEKLGKQYPKNSSYQVSIVEFSMRRGLHEHAKTILNGVRYEEIHRDSQLLMRVAWARAVLGMGDVLKYSFQARRMGFQSAQIHAAYSMLFVSREQTDATDLTKEVVDDDSAVILKVGNERIFYYILKERDLFSNQGEISVQQATTMQLIGRRKKDVFVLRKDAFGNDVQCEILEVQSKYVRAFQETLKQFQKQFPTEQYLQEIKGAPDQFRDDMLKQLDQREESFQDLAKFYQSKKLTFESFAGVLQRSPMELWGMLAGGKYFPLATFSGAPKDAEEEASVAGASESILLELTGIFTIANLGLLGALEKRYRLYTTQPVVDAFAEAYAKVSLEKPFMTLGKCGGNYVKQEITSEQLNSGRNFHKEILKFLSEKVTVVPVPSLLEEDPSIDNIKDFLGKITTATVFAARELKVPVYSDDEVLRKLLKNEWEIAGFSGQFVINELSKSGLISNDQTTEAIARLALLNYRAISINTDVVMWVMARVDFHVTSEVKLVLSIFHGPECTFESALAILTEVCKRAWLEPILYDNKIDLLDAILDALGHNRPIKLIASNFLAVMEHRLFLVPALFKVVSERVRQWKERKLGQMGLILPARYRSGDS